MEIPREMHAWNEMFIIVKYEGCAGVLVYWSYIYNAVNMLRISVVVGALFGEVVIASKL